jgi:hypothetical protein
MRVQALCVVVSSLVFACRGTVHDEQQERCDEVTTQIDAALEDNIDKGVLLPDSIACELTPASFDPRVPASSVEYLLDAFSSACDEQVLCSGISTEVGLPPRLGPPTSGPEPATAP